MRVGTDGFLDRVFVLRENEEGTSVMTATGGILVPDQENNRVLLRLNNGRVLLPDGEFLEFETTTAEHEFELPAPFRSRGESARELNTLELWRAMSDETKSGEVQFATEFHNRLIRSISLVGIALMAVPLGIANSRSPGWLAPVIAIGILAIFDNAIKFVVGLAETGRLDPAVGMWGLALIFNAGGLWLFFMTSGASWGPFASLRRFFRRLRGGSRVPKAVKR